MIKTQSKYEELVKLEIENFILWFWSNEEDRKRPLEALQKYHKEDNYNEVFLYAK